MRVCVICFILINFLSGCNDKRVKFNEQENKLINTYKINDTLVFTCFKTNHRKIFRISGIENDYCGWTEAHPSSEYCGIIRYVKLNDLDRYDSVIKEYGGAFDPRLICIYKDLEGTNVSVAFEDLFYISNGFGKINTDSCIVINDKCFRNYYEFFADTIHRNPDSTALKIIYWQIDYGIIKYVLYNGNTYYRTNL